MKLLNGFLFIILACSKTYAQEKADSSRTEESAFLDCSEPEFPGGNAAMKAYFEKNLIVPTAADSLLPVKCYTRFVVAASGKICNVEVVKSVPYCPECEQEAIRLIINMPDWIPDSIQGKSVNRYMHLPVIFAKSNR